jgi:hypothetical protein
MVEFSLKTFLNDGLVVEARYTMSRFYDSYPQTSVRHGHAYSIIASRRIKK